MYEFESSKRNNLIFYGLASEEGEVTKHKIKKLLQKILWPSILGLLEIDNSKHLLGLQSTGVKNKVDS